jgi:hypothetical protein
MELSPDSMILFHPVCTQPFNIDCISDTLYKDALERNISLSYQSTRNVIVAIVMTVVTRHPRICGTNPASEVQEKLLEWVIMPYSKS